MGAGVGSVKIHREARPPRPRPVCPPLDVVSAAAVKLAEADPTNPVVAYCRSRPEVGRRMIRDEALAYVAKLGAPEGELEIMPLTIRERTAAERYGVGVRSLRRWRRGH